ncbi:PepSY-associated TM helix domain-containing protein [Methylomonas sp. CM2]|uniref:PepSY-associated TM helix domain-containing protein n=1 Tax=Methylomonas sp. CM2 TaxID=3417647 RepID=UPI003CF5F80E
MKIRPFWVLVHRYAGLAMTAFLIVVGLTGSLLAFYEELDGLISPHLYAEPAGRQTLPIPQLLDSAEHALGSRARVASLWLSPRHVDIGVSPNNDAQTGQPLALDFDQVILDPYTGAELGRRHWGSITEGINNLMPFIYKLHYNLALDDIGAWTLGITALVWTLDCFVGFYLTLPAKPLTARAAARRFGGAGGRPGP